MSGGRRRRCSSSSRSRCWSRRRSSGCRASVDRRLAARGRRSSSRWTSSRRSSSPGWDASAARKPDPDRGWATARSCSIRAPRSSRGCAGSAHQGLLRRRRAAGAAGRGRDRAGARRGDRHRRAGAGGQDGPPHPPALSGAARSSRGPATGIRSTGCWRPARPRRCARSFDSAVEAGRRTLAALGHEDGEIDRVLAEFVRQDQRMVEELAALSPRPRGGGQSRLSRQGARPGGGDRGGAPGGGGARPADGSRSGRRRVTPRNAERGLVGPAPDCSASTAGGRRPLRCVRSVAVELVGRDPGQRHAFRLGGASGRRWRSAARRPRLGSATDREATVTPEACTTL